MQHTARQIPGGFILSGWVSLGTSGRELLLEEILVMEPNYYVDGAVNYEDSREPLLSHKTSGDFMTLRGDIVKYEDIALVVDIYPPSQNNYGMWFVAAAGVLLILGVS